MEWCEKMSVKEVAAYEQIINDICQREKPVYDNAVNFVIGFLSPKMEYWCNRNPVLRGGKHEEDLMQEVLIKICKKCKDYFFKPVDGKTERTCDEFKAWCTTVAKNHYCTFCKRNKPSEELDPNRPHGGNDGPDAVETEEIREKINKCFLIVMASKSSIHILLSWIAVSIMMLNNLKYDEDARRSRAIRLVIEKFSGMTLEDMFDVVFAIIANKISWLEIDENKIGYQREKLKKEKDGKAVGGMCLDELYMSKGPEASVSDWVNRVDTQIKENWNNK